jgi:hypothetical protein
MFLIHTVVHEKKYKNVWNENLAVYVLQVL